MTAPRPEPLTCETALERLDAAWLDPLSEEAVDAELLAAREHLQVCSACWAEFERRTAADRHISEAMQAVPVPAGLHEQLLAQSVTDATNVRVAGADSANYAKRKLHRRALGISVAAMLLVGIAGGSWLWRLTHSQQVSMQALCDQTPLTPVGLTTVADFSKLPPLPAAWPRVKGLRVPEPPCWFTLPSTRDAAGWLIFEYKSGRAPAVRGVLLLVRQANVSDTPAELIARPSWSGYTQRGGKPVSVAGWSERGIVYLCFVPGEPESLERVLRATAPTSA